LKKNSFFGTALTNARAHTINEILYISSVIFTCSRQKTAENACLFAKLFYIAFFTPTLPPDPEGENKWSLCSSVPNAVFHAQAIFSETLRKSSPAGQGSCLLLVILISQILFRKSRFLSLIVSFASILT
jgi:hypothetical protein